MIKKWLILALMMVFLSACGGPAETELAPAATPTRARTCLDNAWTLEFHRSGGFAGFDESLTLNSSGELVVESTNPQAAFERSLSTKEIQRIAEFLRAACPFEPASKATDCADCFLYAVTVRTEGEKYQFEATDVNLTGEQSVLVSELQKYFEKP